MFWDSEHLSNVMRRGTNQQNFNIGNISAIQSDKVHHSKVLNCEKFTNATIQGKRQQYLKTANIPAL